MQRWTGSTEKSLTILVGRRKAQETEKKKRKKKKKRKCTLQFFAFLLRGQRSAVESGWKKEEDLGKILRKVGNFYVVYSAVS